jgi:hypothetical protein
MRGEGQRQSHQMVQDGGVWERKKDPMVGDERGMRETVGS